MGLDDVTMTAVRVRRVSRGDLDGDGVVDAEDDESEKEREAKARQIDAQVEREAGEVMMKVKIMIGLCQVLSAFTSNFPAVPWPEELKQLMDAVGFVNLNLLNTQGIACITNTQFVDNFMVMLAAPWIVFASLFLTYQVASRIIITNTQFVDNFM